MIDNDAAMQIATEKLTEYFEACQPTDPSDPPKLLVGFLTVVSGLLLETYGETAFRVTLAELEIQLLNKHHNKGGADNVSRSE